GLLLAVDRYGKKPLFYAQAGATVRFASDAKSFWSVPGASLTVSHAAIDCYLHHLSATTEHAIYEELEKLRPAHYKIFDRGPAGGLRSREVRYWTPNFRDKIVVGEADAL